MPSDAVAPSGQGRPRDPDIDRRVLEAALGLFGDAGWNGFSMEAVARRAGVGKPAVYRRWADKSALMADAFRSIRRAASIDYGSFAQDIHALGRRFITDYCGQYGPALIRLSMDAKYAPEVPGQYPHMVSDFIEQSVDIVRRAQARGEVANDVDGRLVISMVHGAILDLVLFTRPNHRAADEQYIDDYVSQLCDAVIRSFLVFPRAEQF